MSSAFALYRDLEPHHIMEEALQRLERLGLEEEDHLEVLAKWKTEIDAAVKAVEDPDDPL